jgi:aminoglycoside phosphotransferase (APT) family kinase protein
MGDLDLADLTARLDRWAAESYGSGARVTGVEPTPGHAGLSFFLRVLDPDGHPVDDLVVRMPPKGVRRRGNTDVLRQVPLLQALRRTGVPVAELAWWSDDESWFEVPFFMTRRLPGSTYVVRNPDPVFPDDPAFTASVFEQAVDALALVHRLDWRRELAGWEEPRGLEEEIRFWDPILPKAAEPAWIGMGERTRDLLLANLPDDPPVGLFHGDFQTNNLLFHEGRLQAVLDWEISGLGAHHMDLGWLLMMNDPASWHDGEGLARVPAFEGLVGRYAEAAERAVTLHDVAFYRALSGYRFGVISCLNVMLHRTGKRPDEEWERIALSVPALFGRAADLLEGAPG